MLIAREARPAAVHAQPDARLDELGRIPLVRAEWRALPGPVPRPKPLQREAVAFPSFDSRAYARMEELGWDGFWAEHPAGAGRLVPLAAASFDDAVRATRLLVLASRPWMPDGDKQGHAVLEVGGAWYATGLGGITTDSWGEPGAWLLKPTFQPGYNRPLVTALAPEVVAVVGGVRTVDLRGRAGVPVQM